MKEKLQKLKIRLTELAAFVGVSRPTLYKYIDEYETKQYKDINHDVLYLFDYIMKATTFSKLQVMEYIGKMHQQDRSSDMPLVNAILEHADDEHKRELLVHASELLGNKRFVDRLESLINKYSK